MKDRDIFLISILTLVTALCWVVFDAYHAYTAQLVTPNLEEIAIPITPTLDEKLIHELAGRQIPETVTVQLVVPASPTGRPALPTSGFAVPSLPKIPVISSPAAQASPTATTR